MSILVQRLPFCGDCVFPRAYNLTMDTDKASTTEHAVEHTDQIEYRPPRDEEELRVYTEVMEAIESDSWIEYESVDAMLEDLTHKAAALKK